DGDRIAAAILESDDSDGGFQTMGARLDSAEMRQSYRDADRPVAAHAEVADVVEEDDAADAARISRFTQERADHDVAAARLIDDGGAKVIVLPAQQFAALGEWSASQIRAAGDHNACRLAAGVGIDDVNSLHDVSM